MSFGLGRRLTRKDLQRLMKGLPTLKEGYTWYLDFNGIYGGYKLLITYPSTAQSDITPYRLNIREMYCYLEGLSQYSANRFDFAINFEAGLQKLADRLAYQEVFNK